MARRFLALIGIIFGVILILFITKSGLDYSFFVRSLFNGAEQFAERGIISSNFMPIGYSGFLGLCLKAGGISLIPACQVPIYVGILIIAFYFLKWRELKSSLLMLGVFVIAMHPVLLLNIWRVHDGNLTVLLFLSFLTAGFAHLRLKNFWSALIFGICAGLFFTVRQNAFFLFPAALFVLLKSNSVVLKSSAKIAVFVVAAMLSIATVNMSFKGKPFFFGNQGPYNFFSGANEYTEKYLLKDFSGENSLGEALKARGFSLAAASFEGWSTFPGAKYTQMGIEYIKNEPLDYAKLTALKIFTFFRPGYHTPEDFTFVSLDGLKWILKIVLATPFFIWLFFVYKTRKNFFERRNFFTFFAIIFYALPFFIANADPRYRFPLDIIFIADSFCRAREIFPKLNTQNG